MNILNIVKGSGNIGNTKKKYQKAFNDLEEGACYHDPMGMRTGKEFTSKKNFFEQDREQIEMFNEMQEKGFSVEDSIREVRKALDTGDWDLPAYYLPEVELVNPEITPLADMLARQAISQQTVNVTSVGEGDEPTVQTDIEAQNTDYNHSDITFQEHTWDVGSYSIMCGVSDKMILASQPQRNPESIVENVMMETIRQFEEEEIWDGGDDGVFQGTTSGDDVTASFQDIIDTGPGIEDAAVDEGSFTESDLRSIITEAMKKGANRSDLAVVTNFTAYENLQSDLNTQTRYIDFGEELDYGFQTLQFDGVPVMASHGPPDAAGEDDFHTVCFNMSRTYLGMLQDSVVRPLGRQGPQEKVAVDTYGALVHERPEHVIGVTGT